METALFLRLKANGTVSNDVYVMGTHETWHDKSSVDELLEWARAARPEPIVILQPDPQADCRLVKRIRKEMDLKLQCTKSRKCGEGTGWTNMAGHAVD